MIKINLLGDSTATDSSIKLQLAAFVASLVVAFLVFLGINYVYSSSLTELGEKTTRLQSDLQKVQKVTAEVKEYEAKKADYNSKLLVIATLKRSKAGPVRVMDDLNSAVPERAWLTEVKETDGVFVFSGKALDNQTISTFIRELDKSEYYDEPKNEVIKLAEHEGVKIREFSFEAGVLYAGAMPKIEDEKGKDAVSLIEDQSERFVLNFSDWMARR